MHVPLILYSLQLSRQSGGDKTRNISETVFFSLIYIYGNSNIFSSTLVHVAFFADIFLTSLCFT